MLRRLSYKLLLKRWAAPSCVWYACGRANMPMAAHRTGDYAPNCAPLRRSQRHSSAPRRQLAPHRHPLTIPQANHRRRAPRPCACLCLRTRPPSVQPPPLPAAVYTPVAVESGVLGAGPSAQRPLHNVRVYIHTVAGRLAAFGSTGRMKPSRRSRPPPSPDAAGSLLVLPVPMLANRIAYSFVARRVEKSVDLSAMQNTRG